MSIIHNCKKINMRDEVKLFQRYLRLNKKLAFSKDWSKQRKIVDSLYERDHYQEFSHLNNKKMLEDDLEAFSNYSNFDVESLQSEVIRKDIKISLLQEMLKKKPHYAKYFTELEEDLDDTPKFLSNLRNSREAMNLPYLTITQTKALYNNRLSNMFDNSQDLSQSNRLDNTVDLDEKEPIVGMAPRLTLQDLNNIQNPYADIMCLESALDGLDDANLSMISPEDRNRIETRQMKTQINLNVFVIENSIFKRPSDPVGVKDLVTEGPHLYTVNESSFQGDEMYEYGDDQIEASDYNFASKWAPNRNEILQGLREQQNERATNPDQTVVVNTMIDMS